MAGGLKVEGYKVRKSMVFHQDCFYLILRIILNKSGLDVHFINSRFIISILTILTSQGHSILVRAGDVR